MKCVNCNKKYEKFMLSNYNLGLCKACYDKFEKNKNIERDETCDEVEHKITCPKCGKVYKELIVDEKCRTKDCDVWFFWNNMDCMVFAKWMKKDIKVK
ncbi:MAG: hypothetical protein ABIB47_01925 [Candidatus Woesearchaeota archaeon]